MLKGIKNVTQEVDVKISLLSTAETPVKAVEIYPNPTSFELNITLERGIQFEYIIYDLSGKTVSKGFSSKTIDVKPLKSGYYFLSIPEFNLHKKFIKNGSF